MNAEEKTEKVKVGAVSYLNTKPLVYGFEKGMMQNEVTLEYAYPGKIAQALIEKKIDIGLVPVAAIPYMEEYYFAADYCIAADGPVASVCLFSEVPLEQITTVLLDYQSRTSVLLVQYLLKEYWHINPVCKNAGEDFIGQIKDTTAAVVIGDRAFRQRKKSSYIYDLAEAWKNCTGLPFVFAAWISNKPLSLSFIHSFNAANEYGLQRLSEVIRENPCSDFDLATYYTQYIHYRLDDNKRAGLQKFLSWCSQLDRSNFPVPVS